MRLVAMVNPPTSQYAEAWRHPASRTDWLDLAFYRDLAATLERGCFDLMFLPDALAVPEDHAGDYGTTLRTGGKGAIHLDPMLVLAAVAAGTTHLGLGATVSTTFTPAYTIARSMLSLDHLSGGRVAWNVVTSTTDAQARNFGLPAIPAPADRYDHADDVVRTVLDLWAGWEPGALVLDAAGRMFADPDRVHRVPVRDDRPPLSRGPVTLPRSPQGRPVLMQAGASDRGRDFAARWAELVFVVADTPDAMREVRADLRARAVHAGRDPDTIAVLPAVQPVVGPTGAAARATLADLERLLDPHETLVMLARLLHTRVEQLDPDASATDLVAAHRGATGSEGFERMLRDACRRDDLTVRQLADRQAVSQLKPQPVGDGAEVADELCDLVDSGAGDGFVLTSAVFPGSLEAFVDEVVPELQRRGRFRRAYPGRTLRATLGLDGVRPDP